MEQGLSSVAFLSGLFSIVLMDLVLAGDNALVIGLAARSLPRETRLKAIVCGTIGAIVVRAAMAILIVHVLTVPGLMLAGGIALAWISRKLLTPGPGAENGHAAARPPTTLMGAIRIIVIADAIMGIDNVLAIGGAARGSIPLIALGLAISVPIIVWGSNVVIRIVERYPSVILLGGAVLAWTGYSMIVHEPLLARWFEGHPPTRRVTAVLVFLIALAPWIGERLPTQARRLVTLLPALLVWMLAFDVAASMWRTQIDDLLAAGPGEYLLEGVRWTGWLPLAALHLWMRERLLARPSATVPAVTRSHPGLAPALHRDGPLGTTGSHR